MLISYDLILKKDRRLGWKLVIYGEPTIVKEIVESLTPNRKRYLKKRLVFKSKCNLEAFR